MDPTSLISALKQFLDDVSSWMHRNNLIISPGLGGNLGGDSNFETQFPNIFVYNWVSLEDGESD